jgi:hypothetical protein
MNPMKTFYKSNIALTLYSLLISLVLLELAVRGWDYYELNKPSYRILFEQYKKVFSDERDKEYIFGHKPNVNVTIEEDNRAYTIITNSEGLRETKDYDYLEKSVIFLGDSIVEGSSVDNHEVMDEIFGNRTGITSLNFGVGSSHTAHEYFWLKSKYKNSYNTKLVVLGFCLNDFRFANVLRYFDSSSGNWPFYKQLDEIYGKAKDQKSQNTSKNNLWKQTKDTIKKSRLASFIYDSMQDILNTGAHSFSSSQVDRESRYYVELYINKINKFVEEIGSEFVVVIFPNEIQLEHDYESGQRMQDVLIEILKKNQIKYIDLYDFMRKRYIKEPEVIWYHDITHPYKEGHRVIGEHLAQKLPVMFPEVFK